MWARIRSHRRSPYPHVGGAARGARNSAMCYDSSLSPRSSLSLTPTAKEYTRPTSSSFILCASLFDPRFVTLHATSQAHTRHAHPPSNTRACRAPHAFARSTIVGPASTKTATPTRSRVTRLTLTAVAHAENAFRPKKLTGRGSTPSFRGWARSNTVGVAGTTGCQPVGQNKHGGIMHANLDAQHEHS